MWTHATKGSVWSIWCIGKVGLRQIAHGSPFPTWGMPPMLFATSMPPILPLLVACGAFHLLIFSSYSAMSGRRLRSLRSRRLIAWKSILRRGAVLHTLRHGTLFPLLVFALTLRFRANGRCRSVQARLCRKCCGHVISLGPYLLSMTSSPSTLVAVPGFSSFISALRLLISTPFAIRRW